MGSMFGGVFVVFGHRMRKDKTEAEEHHHDFKPADDPGLLGLFALSRRNLLFP
jgi:hypothetical protein